MTTKISTDGAGCGEELGTIADVLREMREMSSTMKEMKKTIDELRADNFELRSANDQLNQELAAVKQRDEELRRMYGNRGEISIRAGRQALDSNEEE